MIFECPEFPTLSHTWHKSGFQQVVAEFLFVSLTEKSIFPKRKVALGRVVLRWKPLQRRGGCPSLAVKGLSVCSLSSWIPGSLTIRIFMFWDECGSTVQETGFTLTIPGMEWDGGEIILCEISLLSRPSIPLFPFYFPQRWTQKITLSCVHDDHKCKVG